MRAVVLLFALAAAGCAVPTGSPPAVAPVALDVDAGPGELPLAAELVVVTLNTHSFQEGDTSLEKLGQIGEQLALLDADIVGLNEIMSGAFFAYDMGGEQHDAAATVKAALEAASGVSWYLARAGFAHWDTGEEMANVILSRTPFLEEEARPLPTTDFWPAPASARNVLYVRTLVEGVGPVNVFLTHAWGWSSADTQPQVDAVKAFMAERYRGDEAIDLLLGDLNMPSTWDGYDAWRLSGSFELLDTWAAANPGSAELPTLFDEDHRIDYIMAGAGLPLSVRALWSSAIVFDGDTTPRVSDHKGVRTVIRMAE